MKKCKRRFFFYCFDSCLLKVLKIWRMWQPTREVQTIEMTKEATYDKKNVKGSMTYMGDETRYSNSIPHMFTQCWLLPLIWLVYDLQSTIWMDVVYMFAHRHWNPKKRNDKIQTRNSNEKLLYSIKEVYCLWPFRTDLLASDYLLVVTVYLRLLFGYLYFPFVATCAHFQCFPLVRQYIYTCYIVPILNYVFLLFIYFL